MESANMWQKLVTLALLLPAVGFGSQVVALSVEARSAGCVHDGTGRVDCNQNDDGSSDNPPPKRDRGDSDDPGSGGGSGGSGGGGGTESDEGYPPGLICDHPDGCPGQPPAPPDAPERDGGGSVAPPVPSESDFASFQIPPSTPHALPVDWTVTGKPTAFWADASVRTFSAELLGFPLQVRATPIEFHWDFGDGNSTSTTSPGQEPSHPQHGSITHTYSKKGQRTVTLTTVYTGEYNYGSGWSTIPGTAAVESDGLPMTVYRYHKYRVEDDCNDNPYGTDCVNY